VTPGAFQTTYVSVFVRHAFVTKLNPTGSALIYSTYFGGSNHTYGKGIALDSSGNPYITGNSVAINLPTTPGVFQPTYAGGVLTTNELGGDTFVAKFAEATGPIPGVSADGVVNAASFAPRANLATGGIGALFGTGLASSTAVATAVPLPANLGGATVLVNGIPAPLFFVSPGQINFQMPWEVAGPSGIATTLTVTVEGVTSSAATVSLRATPGIFSLNQTGSGQGAILIATTGEIAAPSGSVPGRAARPVRRGEYISIYCTGLGAVTNPPATGAVASGNPLSTTTTTPTVSIGGRQATVSFSGLAPGFVGLYQINAQAPENAPTGNAVSVVINAAAYNSNTVTIAVQ
jgi:uncharacterized protein (TIGR03437 family)